MQCLQVEGAARRQESERTSIARARAESATELSTSRRLKSELARTFAIQQRHAKGVLDALPVPFANRPSLGQHGGGDAGAGIGAGVGRRGISKEQAVEIASVPNQVAIGPGGAGGNRFR